MKRISKIYNTISSWSNLLAAHRKSRKNKRFNSSSIKFSSNVEEELINIQNHLVHGTYKVGAYYEFKVTEPKLRTIQALPFRDRVVQHALYNVLQPLLEKGMINDSYACRIGKGSQRGMLTVQKYMRAGGANSWILKCDISKFFASIDCRILKRILAKKIKDRRTLWLCYKFIGKGKGIPIGNLTSQLYANIYLDQLDHYVKDNLGYKKYVRYMDDFVIICENKEVAVALKLNLSEWLLTNLELKMNAKTQIFPERQGIDFLGYAVKYDHIKIRHTTVRRLKGKIKVFRENITKGRLRISDIIPTLKSWQGMSKWGNCRTIETKILTILNEVKNGAKRL